ncbi:MAG: M23 family metallopeptidase, partial [Myxococcales bacterium]|nr:M23 family metallopeptidase [Myxococcales bacterium]
EYFHMSRFARGLYPGKKVRRGQIIGYVGTTGRSTAPHLHFGVRKGGVHVDPLQAFDTPGKSVPTRELLAFKTSVKPVLALLSQISTVAKARGIE